MLPRMEAFKLSITCLLYLINLKRLTATDQTLSLSLQEIGTSTTNSFSLQFNIKTDSLIANLTRNERIVRNVPTYVTNSNYSSNENSTNLTRWSYRNNQKDFVTYQDLANRITITKIVEMDSYGFPSITYTGLFPYNGNYFSLIPPPVSSKPTVSKRKKRSNNIYSAVLQQPILESFGPGYGKTSVSVGDMQVFLGLHSGTKFNYVSEIFFVIDYSVYTNWFDSIDSSKSYNDRKIQAIESIQYYYSNIANGMDLRYSSVNSSEISIRVNLAGFIIATDVASSPWTENYLKVVNGAKVLDTYSALTGLTTWVKTIRASSPNFPLFDNIMLFTKHQMFAGYNSDGSSNFISGLAYIQAICTPFAVGISKDNGEYATINTASHELGHNLGSYHDGSGNTCDPNQQFLMSPAPGQLSQTTFLHPFNFSLCSISYMNNYLGTMSLTTDNCLLSTSKLIITPIATPSQPFGQFLPINQQCINLFGKGSFYCGGMINDLIMCSQLSCFDPSSQTCINSVNYRAADGTNCGNKKWCFFGSCVYNASAPLASDFCMSGDYQGDAINCVTYINANPSSCYDDYYNGQCCASCNAIKKTGNCPFGDNNPSYCKTLQPTDCYSSVSLAVCCATCSRYQRYAIPGCTYGDKANWCSTISGASCYTDNSICCATCYTFYQGYTGCEYGDKVTWCVPNSNQCYITLNQCCLTCNPSKVRKTNSIPLLTQTITTTKPQLRGAAGCVDSTSYCITMPLSYCYTAVYYSACPCACTLNPTQSSNQLRNCAYGDLSIWCSNMTQVDCNSIDIKYQCCHTCALNSSHTILFAQWNISIILICFTLYRII